MDQKHKQIMLFLGIVGVIIILQILLVNSNIIWLRPPP